MCPVRFEQPRDEALARGGSAFFDGELGRELERAEMDLLRQMLDDCFGARALLLLKQRSRAHPLHQGEAQKALGKDLPFLLASSRMPQVRHEYTWAWSQVVITLNISVLWSFHTCQLN